MCKSEFQTLTSLQSMERVTKMSTYISRHSVGSAACRVPAGGKSTTARPVPAHRTRTESTSFHRRKLSHQYRQSPCGLAPLIGAAALRTTVSGCQSSAARHRARKRSPAAVRNTLHALQPLFVSVYY